VPTQKTSTLEVPFSAAQKSSTRTIPYHPETAAALGGGARGRTLAIIYRQLCYWSKYAKWKGSGGKKFFYKSQKELAGELGYSEKTINRAIKALRELGLVIVEKLQKTYWRQVFFYYLPHSPHRASTAAPVGRTAPVSAPRASTPAPAPVAAAAVLPTGAAVDAPPTASTRPVAAGKLAGLATAASIRTRGAVGFGQNVRIQQREYKPLIKQTLGTIVERCNEIALRMKKERDDNLGLEFG
jgi:DNA-binding MarR family transcriptional regulator